MKDKIKKIGVLGVLINLILLVIKMVIGLMFKSHAIIADALNSFSDVFSSIITYVGAKISNIPADENHDFGHEKAEYIGSLLIAVFMIVASLNMIYESISSIVIGKEYIYSNLLFIVPLVTIIIKLLFYMYVKNINKNYNNLLLSANSKDQINDVYISIGIVITIIAMMYKLYFVDIISSILISLIILKTGIDIFKESSEVLTDKAIDFNLNNDIVTKINENKQVLSIDSIKSKTTGYKHLILIAITIDKNITVEEGHKIAHNIEEMIKKEEKI